MLNNGVQELFATTFEFLRINQNCGKRQGIQNQMKILLSTRATTLMFGIKFPKSDQFHY
jgi:hypothetical protein